MIPCSPPCTGTLGRQTGCSQLALSSHTLRLFLNPVCSCWTQTGLHSDLWSGLGCTLCSTRILNSGHFSYCADRKEQNNRIVERNHRRTVTSSHVCLPLTFYLKFLSKHYNHEQNPVQIPLRPNLSCRD